MTFCFLSCKAQENHHKKAKQVDSLNITKDSFFINKIRNLRMVTAKEKESGELEYFVKDTPTIKSPYYIIQVGKSNSYRLEVFYNFYCYPKSGEIKLYDVVSDSLLVPPLK
ncbi:MAG: hypothetical protein ABI112_12270 [Terracoccus sp.]